jgi:hypothetical protein
MKMPTLELTEAQRNLVVQGAAVRVCLPDFGGDVVLLRAGTYEEIREIPEDERASRYRPGGCAKRWMPLA